MRAAFRLNPEQDWRYTPLRKLPAVTPPPTKFHIHPYYRDKYKGVERLGYAWKHMLWLVLDMVWGNGESLLRVLLTALAALLVAARRVARVADCGRRPNILFDGDPS